MYSLRPPFFYRMLSPTYLLCSVPGVSPVLYLTFDDGPVPEVTPRVLEILQEAGVKATFFCVGDNVQRNPEIYSQILDAGHATGNHTWHHLNGWTTPPGAYLEDTSRCAGVVQSTLFRPPYGRITPSQYLLLRKSYRIVLWSLLSGDFDKHITPEKCLKNLTDNVRPGDIIVFHDSLKAFKNLEFALPSFLKYAASEGYSFALLPPRRPSSK